MKIFALAGLLSVGTAYAALPAELSTYANANSDEELGAKIIVDDHGLVTQLGGKSTSASEVFDYWMVSTKANPKAPIAFAGADSGDNGANVGTTENTVSSTTISLTSTTTPTGITVQNVFTKATDYSFQQVVTVTNNGDSDLTDVQYRRILDFDAVPDRLTELDPSLDASKNFVSMIGVPFQGPDGNNDLGKIIHSGAPSALTANKAKCIPKADNPTVEDATCDAPGYTKLQEFWDNNFADDGEDQMIEYVIELGDIPAGGSISITIRLGAPQSQALALTEIEDELVEVAAIMRPPDVDRPSFPALGDCSYKSSRGICYHRTGTKIYSDAKAYCENKLAGYGKLPEIRSDVDWEEVKAVQNLGGCSRIWLGAVDDDDWVTDGSDLGTEGKWYWHTDGPQNTFWEVDDGQYNTAPYFRWATSSEPNDYMRSDGVREDCLEQYCDSYNWNDIFCDSSKVTVCDLGPVDCEAAGPDDIRCFEPRPLYVGFIAVGASPIKFNSVGAQLLVKSIGLTEDSSSTCPVQVFDSSRQTALYVEKPSGDEDCEIVLQTDDRRLARKLAGETYDLVLLDRPNDEPSPLSRFVIDFVDADPDSAHVPLEVDCSNSVVFVQDTQSNVWNAPMKNDPAAPLAPTCIVDFFGTFQNPDQYDDFFLTVMAFKDLLSEGKEAVLSVTPIDGVLVVVEDLVSPTYLVNTFNTEALPALNTYKTTISLELNRLMNEQPKVESDVNPRNLDCGFPATFMVGLGEPNTATSVDASGSVTIDAFDAACLIEANIDGTRSGDFADYTFQFDIDAFADCGENINEDYFQLGMTIVMTNANMLAGDGDDTVLSHPVDGFGYEDVCFGITGDGFFRPKVDEVWHQRANILLDKTVTTSAGSPSLTQMIMTTKYHDIIPCDDQFSPMGRLAVGMVLDASSLIDIVGTLEVKSATIDGDEMIGNEVDCNMDDFGVAFGTPDKLCFEFEAETCQIVLNTIVDAKPTPIKTCVFQYLGQLEIEIERFATSARTQSVEVARLKDPTVATNARSRDPTGDERIHTEGCPTPATQEDVSAEYDISIGVEGDNMNSPVEIGMTLTNSDADSPITFTIDIVTIELYQPGEVNPDGTVNGDALPTQIKTFSTAQKQALIDSTWSAYAGDAHFCRFKVAEEDGDECLPHYAYLQVADGEIDGVSENANTFEPLLDVTYKDCPDRAIRNTDSFFFTPNTWIFDRNLDTDVELRVTVTATLTDCDATVPNPGNQGRRLRNAQAAEGKRKLDDNVPKVVGQTIGITLRNAPDCDHKKAKSCTSDPAGCSMIKECGNKKPTCLANVIIENYDCSAICDAKVCLSSGCMYDKKAGCKEAPKQCSDYDSKTCSKDQYQVNAPHGCIYGKVDGQNGCYSKEYYKEQVSCENMDSKTCSTYKPKKVKGQTAPEPLCIYQKKAKKCEDPTGDQGGDDCDAHNSDPLACVQNGCVYSAENSCEAKNTACEA